MATNIEHARRLREMNGALTSGQPVAFNAPYQEALEAGAQALERATNLAFGPDGAHEIKQGEQQSGTGQPQPQTHQQPQPPLQAVAPAGVRVDPTVSPNEVAAAHARDARAEDEHGRRQTDAADSEYRKPTRGK